MLLAGPAVLAFFAGGYFDAARNWAGLLAWALVAGACLAAPRPLRPSYPALLALGALMLLALWTLASFTWSPVAGTAFHDGQRVLLYAGALGAGTLLLSGRGGELAEPVLAAGAVAVIAYGISERLLPGLLTFQHSFSAEGRLEQPLTYWNAMGALGAVGLVLALRLAGDLRRPGWLRWSAGAGAAPLGLGLYLSFSRGALFAAAAGVVTLIVLDPSRTAWRAVGIGLAAALGASLGAAPFAGVTMLQGSRHARIGQGAVVLITLIVCAAGAALALRHLERRDLRNAPAATGLRLPAHAGLLAAGLIVAALSLFLAVGAKEKSNVPLASGARRLATLQSNRYAYWKVAWRDFEAQPLRGVGGGGWAVDWLRYRPFDSGAQDAHSLPIQTAAELGVVGLALLLAFLASVALAARRAWLAGVELAAGPAAGCIVWLCHSMVDWDWEMPALTLVALLLAAALLARSNQPADHGARTTGDPAIVPTPA